jgi:hypothetical protein
MHYCISSLIAEKFNIDNKNEFMLGGIAPDIHGLMGVAKGVTHFKDRSENGKSYINYLRFYETYKDVFNEPFYLGYLCHLISDDVWLNMYFKKVNFISPEQWKESLHTTYRDFERLNGRIIKHYSLHLQEHGIPEVQIDGYNNDFLPTLLELLCNDFVDNKHLMSEPLELFDNDNSEIFGYIDRSVSKSINFLTSVQVS